MGSLPSSMCKEFFKIPVSEFSEKWVNASGHTIMAYPVAGKWYEEDFNGVVRYNEATRQKQLNDWELNKTKIFIKIDEIKSKLECSGKGRKITSKGLINRIADAIPKQYRGLFEYKIVEVDGKPKLEFKLDQVRETEHISAMGKTVIFTDQKELTLRQIVETYDARNQIETDIAYLKEKLLIPLKPVYVRKDIQIRAHVFLCVVGLLLYNYLLFVQMSPTLKYLRMQIQALVGQMVQVDETDLIYKGPWVRSAQQRLFQTLEADYSFPKATCRSLVNLMWDFLNETFGEKLHEGQITFYAASASEPPGKRLSEIKSVPVHLTFHDRNDMNILTEKGTSGLRKHKILRMASEALVKNLIVPPARADDH